MDAALTQLKEISPKVEGILMDLKSFDSVKTASGELRKTVDHIDILILNAGIDFRIKTLVIPFISGLVSSLFNEVINL